MKARYSIFLMPFSAMLLACGPAQDKEDSASAPTITNDDLGVVCPFDTLEVEFSTELEDLSSSQVTSNNPVKTSLDEDIVQLWGDSTYSADVSLLLPGKTYTITFKNLESTKGEVQDEPQTLTFETMPMLDSDGKDPSGTIHTNGNYGTAEILADSAKFFDGTLLEKGISVAGVISGIARGIEDYDDWYRIRVKEGDSIQIKLSHLRDNLRIRCYGPENSAGEMSDEITESDKSGTTDEKLVFSPTASRHSFGTRNLDSYLNYWIRVSPSANKDLKSPYVLAVQRLN